MNESHESLIFSLKANKGVYALLLGSGISRSSGVLSGWDVMIDLVGRIKVIREPNDEKPNYEWYLKTFGKQPNYSDILAVLCPSQADRSALLKPFFEKNATDEEESKQPSLAHRAVAELMKLGYIRIVITTNFDRLLEQACYDIGVHPTVISSESAIPGMLPLAHQKQLILKIHGDYQEPETLNTIPEVSEYPSQMSSLLERILQEFGLIICGWSGDWDLALASAIDKCSNRRFSLFWTAYHGELSDKSKELASRKSAIVIPINGADDFFQKTLHGIDALEQYQTSSKMSLDLLISTAKKHLSADPSHILIQELLSDEEKDFYTKYIAVDLSTYTKKDEIVPIYYLFEGISDRLIVLYFLIGKYCTAKLSPIVLNSIVRILGSIPREAGLEFRRRLREYPGLLFTYSLGMGMLANNNDQFFAQLISSRVIDSDKRCTELREFYDLIDVMQYLLDEVNISSASSAMYETMKRHLSRFYLSNKLYTDAFDWFEYLFFLMKYDSGCYEKGNSEIDFMGRAGAGGFYARRSTGDFSPTYKLLQMILRQGESCSLLHKDGPFGGTLKRLKHAFAHYERLISAHDPYRYWNIVLKDSPESVFPDVKF